MAVSPTNLDPGFNVLVVNAAATTGTGASNPFTVQPTGDSGDRNVTFRPFATGTVTTCTADLESSDDNQVTWSVYPGGAGIVFSALAQAQILHLVAGVVYRLNIKTLSLGSAASVSINAAAG